MRIERKTSLACLLVLGSLSACSSSSSSSPPSDGGMPVNGDAMTPAKDGSMMTTADVGSTSLDSSMAVDSGSSSDGSMTIDSGTAIDSGMAVDSGMGMGGDGGIASGGQGDVIIAQDLFISGNTRSFSYDISATFFTPPMPPCTMTISGECQFVSCPANVMASYVSAGDITVSGGRLPQAISLMPDAARRYQGSTGQTAGFASSADLFHIVAQGAAGGVPAFDEMIAAPSTATITAPLFIDGQTMTINRGSDLTVTWTHDAQASGMLQVGLEGPSGPSSPLEALSCQYPIVQGAATIPSAALMMIGMGQGTILISPLSSRDLQAGGFALKLVVRGTSVASSGVVAFAFTNLQ
jgi:hypothetical protein